MFNLSVVGFFWFVLLSYLSKCCMTKEHNCEERVLRDWYNNVIIIQVWAPLSLSGVLELPQTLYTGMCSVSLLILTPQNFWVVFCVRGSRFIPSRRPPNNLLFIWPSVHLERSYPRDTPSDWFSYRPPQASMSPYNLWKLLFSHFHTDNPYR